VSGVVIFWAATSTVGLEDVERYAAMKGEKLCRVSLRELGAQALASTAYAPVVAVVEDDRAATEALGAGVDEIVRRGDLSTPAIEQAVKRAEVRARGRLRALVTTMGDEASAFGNLLDWVAIELVSCMSGAVLESELLEESVKRLVAGHDTRASRSSDIRERLETVKDSQRRTREVLEAVRSLSGADAARTSASEVIGALARVIQSRAVPLADVEVESEGICATAIPVPKLVGALVAVLSEALDRASAAQHTGPGRVQLILRAYVAEEATVVEIEDSAGEQFIPGPGQASALGKVRSAMNDLGADVIVEATGNRTTVRLLLPPVEDSLPRTSDVTRLSPAAERLN
jgi:hypothetical protein